MQQIFNKVDEYMMTLKNVQFLIGNTDTVRSMPNIPAFSPFSDEMVSFLNEVSKTLMADQRARQYSDVVTFAFWIRRSSVLKLKERFKREDGNIYFGRGIAFHIAPSNVPVNYAYSLVTGLLTGNANIVRIPSKDFPQVELINEALERVLGKYAKLRPYICLVRYERDQKINDLFSAIADTRIVWGGDETIAEIRKSKMAARAGEITFADRFSLAIIDSDEYLNQENKSAIAEAFYNDTYLTDQNACTSPRMVVWVGKKKEEAKTLFWSCLRDIVKNRYTFQAIQGINKLTSSYILASRQKGVRILKHTDNLIVRVSVPEITNALMDLKDNSGYFFEYDCNDIRELCILCNDTHCQTISYLGRKEMLLPLLALGVKGIDRVVPLGKTMDFDFIWDGYNLYERLTRTISFQG